MQRLQKATSIPAEQHLAGGPRTQNLPTLRPHAAAHDGFQHLCDLQRRLHRPGSCHRPPGSPGAGRSPQNPATAGAEPRTAGSGKGWEEPEAGAAGLLGWARRLPFTHQKSTAVLPVGDGGPVAREGRTGMGGS